MSNVLIFQMNHIIEYIVIHNITNTKNSGTYLIDHWGFLGPRSSVVLNEKACSMENWGSNSQCVVLKLELTLG